MHEKDKRTPIELKEDLLKIGQRCETLPDLDSHSADDIMGYDETGLPN